MSTRHSGKVLAAIVALGLFHPAPSFADDADYDTSMAQARVFIKKKWYREAVKELRRAVSTRQGEASFEAHLLLSQACFKEFDLGCAFKVAEEARGLARNPEERSSSQSTLEYLGKNFGKVEFRAGEGELTEGYLELIPQDPILDKDVKQYFVEKVAPLANQRRTLPWIMYLPAVTYKLHGHSFELEGGQELVVNAGFNAENSAPRAVAPPPPPEFEGVGVAVQLRLGGGVAMRDLQRGGMNYGPVADVSINKTLGNRFSAGGFLKFNYELLDHSDLANIALTYGALASARLPLRGGLALQPAAGYGFGQGPAVYFSDCSSVMVLEEETVVCQDSTATGPYSTWVRSQMHGPVGRLELAYERRGERRIMTGQLGLQAHYGLFSEVVGGTGSFEESGVSSPFTVPEDYSVSSLRLELMAGFNMTF